MKCGEYNEEISIRNQTSCRNIICFVEKKSVSQTFELFNIISQRNVYKITKSWAWDFVNKYMSTIVDAEIIRYDVKCITNSYINWIVEHEKTIKKSLRNCFRNHHFFFYLFLLFSLFAFTNVIKSLWEICHLDVGKDWRDVMERLNDGNFFINEISTLHTLIWYFYV